MTITLVLPPLLRMWAQNLKGAGVSYKILVNFLLFFILDAKTFSGLARLFPKSYSVSSLSRHAKIFPFNRFRRRLLTSLLKYYGGKVDSENFCLIIDDTDNPKWGKNFWGVGMWGSSKGTYHGQKVIVVALADIRRRIAVPIAYDIVTKSESATKTKKKGAPTILDRAITLLKTAKAEGYQNLPVVVDSWFDSSSFIRDIEQLGFTYYGELKSRRRVKFESSSSGVPWQKLTEVFAGFYRSTSPRHWRKVLDKRHVKKIWLAEAHLVIRKRKEALHVIAAYSRKNSKAPIGYYATTERGGSGARIWLLSRVRWGIECIFRTSKQSLSFGSAASGGEAASHLAVALPLLLYSLFYIAQDASTSGTNKTSIDLEVARLRATMTRKSIDVMLGRPEHPVVDRLRARLSPRYAHQKPRNRAVGDRMAA